MKDAAEKRVLDSKSITEKEGGKAEEEANVEMKDAAEKRVLDSKSITEKEGVKAEEEANVEKNGQERLAKMKEAMATVSVIEGLHKDCDWLLKNFEVRKEARAGEVDALKKAKVVLSGADFS